MSENKITGAISAILPVEPISNGKYNKLVFAVKNNEGYEGKEQVYAFEIFEKSDGDKIEKFKQYNQLGKVVDVSYEIRCNENKGRYFTSLSAWKVFGNETAGAQTSQSPPVTDETLSEEPPF